MNIAELPRACLAQILDLCDESTKLALRATCHANRVSTDATAVGLQCCIWARDPSEDLKRLSSGLGSSSSSSSTSLGSAVTSLLLPRGVVVTSIRQQQGLCFPRLQHLCLNYRLAAPCRALAAAAGTSLTSLTITQGGTRKGTRWLRKHCRLLRELQRLPALRRLHCALALLPVSAEVVGRLSQLQSLTLTGARLSPSSGPGARTLAAITPEPPFGPDLWRLAIEPLTGLTRLDLALPLLVPQHPGTLLGPLSQLRCLQLQLLQDRGPVVSSVAAHRDCAAGAAGAARLLATFPPLQHLTRLQVSAAPPANYWMAGASELEPDTFHCLGQLPQLRSLELSLAHWQVSLRDLQPLSACRQLTELVLPELVLSLAEDPERAELSGPELTAEEQAAVAAAMAAAAAAGAPAAEACSSSSSCGGGGGGRWSSSGAGALPAEVTVFGEPHAVPLLPGLRRLACRTLYWRLPLALLAPALEDVTYKRLRNLGHGSYVLPDLWPEANLLDALQGGGNPGEGAGAFVVNLLNQLMDNNPQLQDNNNPWLAEGGGINWFENLQPVEVLQPGGGQGNAMQQAAIANWHQQVVAGAAGDQGLLAELEQLAVQLAGMAEGLAGADAALAAPAAPAAAGEDGAPDAAPAVGAGEQGAAAAQPGEGGGAGPSHAAAGNALQHAAQQQHEQQEHDGDHGSEDSSEHESFWQCMEQVAEHEAAEAAAAGLPPPHPAGSDDFDYGYDYDGAVPAAVPGADVGDDAAGPVAPAAAGEAGEPAAAVGDHEQGAGPLALVPWAQQLADAAAAPAAGDGPPPAPIALQEAPLTKVVGDVLRGQACLQVLDVDVTALCKVARLSSLPLARLRALRLHMLGEVKLPPGGLPPLPCLTSLEFYLPDERNWETDYNDDEDLALWQHQASVRQVTVRGTYHAGGFFAPQHLARAAACMPRLQVFTFQNCWDLRGPSLQRVLQSGVAPVVRVVMPARPPPLQQVAATPAATSGAAVQEPRDPASGGFWNIGSGPRWPQDAGVALPPAGLAGEAAEVVAAGGGGCALAGSSGSGTAVGDEQADAASSSSAASSSGGADNSHAWLAGQQECSPEAGPSSGCDSEDDAAGGSTDELAFAPYRPGQPVNQAVVRHMAAAAAAAGVELVWVDSPVAWSQWLGDS